MGSTTVDAVLIQFTLRDVSILEEAGSGSVSCKYQVVFDTLKERAECWVRMAGNGGKECGVLLQVCKLASEGSMRKSYHIRGRWGYRSAGRVLAQHAKMSSCNLSPQESSSASPPRPAWSA